MYVFVFYDWKHVCVSLERFVSFLIGKDSVAVGRICIAYSVLRGNKYSFKRQEEL
jgi:hypothetical protein